MQLDVTKAHEATCKHRLLLHNNMGVSVMQMIFGYSFCDVPTQQLATDHIIEDLGEVPSVDRVVEHTPDIDFRLTLPVSIYSGKVDDRIIWLNKRMVEKFKGRPSDYTRIHELLFLPLVHSHTKDSRCLNLTFNSFGPFLLETIIGPFFLNSIGREVPTRYIAERAILTMQGEKIFSIAELFQKVPLEGWMCLRALELSKKYKDVVQEPRIKAS